MTNPYQAPSELDWQNSQGDQSDSQGLVGAKQYFVKLALMAGSIACSGACLGGCFGLMLAPPGGVFAGLIVGLIAAFIPSVVSCLLCLGIAGMFSNYSEQGKNVVCGLASGAFAGFVSIMVVFGGSTLDDEALLLSALASVFGAVGGLCGAFLVNRWLRRNELLTA